MARPEGRVGFSLRETLVLGVWIGLLGGLCEAAMLAVARLGFNRAIHADVHVAWAVPVSLATLGFLAAIPAGFLARTPAGRRWPALPLWILCFVAVGNLTLVFFQIHPLAKVLLAAGIAAQAAIFLSRRQEGLVRLSKRTLVPLLAMLGLLGVGTPILLRVTEMRSLAALPAPAPTSPNVLLIVLDTERALDLSLYGYGRRTTPTLDSLAREGTVFARAYATSSWTLSSHASMFTGRLPQELGVGWLTPLGARHRTLAEVFSARGYVTGGFSANTFYVTRASGLAQGFAHFEGRRLTPLTVLLRSSLATTLARPDIRGGLFNWYQTPSRKSARHLRGDVLSWLERAPANRPYFAFINLFDAHQPYLAPPPFDTMFTGRQANWDARNPMLEVSGPVTGRDVAAERDAYDQAIAWQDYELGVLLSRLREAGRLENTLVAITADHGEEFGEHGLIDHGLSLNPSALWVPLVVLDAGSRQRAIRVPDVVSLVDLPATLLMLADSARPSELPGVNLFRSRQNTTGPDFSPAIAQLPRGIGTRLWAPVSEGPLVSLTRDSSHYVVNSAGNETLLDLSADPAGRVVPVDSPAYRMRVGPLRTALDSAMKRKPGGE